MKEGIKNILSSTFPSLIVDDYLEGDTEGLLLTTLDETNMKIPIIWGENGKNSFINVGNISAITTGGTSVTHATTKKTIATLALQFDPLITVYTSYLSLLAMVGTGVVPPTDQFEKLR